MPIKAALSVGSMTALSRISGFARDAVIAQVFGANAATDAFFAAFRIPNLLRRLYAEGAVAQAIVPLVSPRPDRTAAPIRDVLSGLFGWFGIAGVVLTLTCLLAASLIVGIMAGGFESRAQIELARELLQIMSPYGFFACIAALSSALLNARGCFAVPAAAPILLNLSMLTSALMLSGSFAEPIMGLAWGVCLAGLAQVAWQLPSLASRDLLAHWRWLPRLGAVQQAVSALGPALFSAAVGQINLLIDTFIASFLAAGSISWLYYSDRLVEFPLGIIGVAIGTALLPALSHQRLATDSHDFERHLTWGLRWIWVLGLPATMGLIVLAEPISLVLFGSDQFSSHDVAMSAQSLRAYAIGLPALLGIKVLLPAFSARGIMAVTVRYGTVSMVANVVFNAAFWLLSLGHWGIALATGLAAWVNFGALWIGLRKFAACLHKPRWLLFMARVLGACGTLALVLQISVPSDWLTLSGSERLFRLIGSITAAGLTYLVTLFGLGLRLAELSPSGKIAAPPR